MNKIKTKKIVMAALFTALTVIATMLIIIPIPGGSGYVNMGDAIILIGSFVGTHLTSMIFAGLGSGLADILSGYALYALATIIVKGLMGLVASKVFISLKKSTKGAILSAVLAEIIMISGYFIYEMFILKVGAMAYVSIGANGVQGAFAIAVSIISYYAIKKSGALKKLGL